MSYWTGTHWVADEPATGAPKRRPSRTRHALEAITEGGLVALLVVGLLAGTAFAGKGGNAAAGGGKAPSTIALVLLDSTDGQAHNGQRVAFDVSTTATDRPFVGVRCYQGSAFVLDGYTGYFPTYMFEPWVILDSPYWQEGVAADCTARLFHYDKRGNQKVLATLDFAALP